jgi:hydroxymethylbilane synthase
MISPHFTIATRESRLALWQAEHIKSKIEQLYPLASVQLLGMTTRGDQILDRSLSKVGGKGLFVKELEQALLENRAQLAVHSLKDVPMDLPDGFELCLIGPRENPQDAWVSPHVENPSQLPKGAVIGTSSLRRACQLKALYPDLTIQPLRGNLDTRLKKLDQGLYQGIVLAAAGLIRLDLGHRIRQVFPLDHCIPAVGQGALGLEFRSDHPNMRNWLAPLRDINTERCVIAERTFSKRLAGSCDIPLGAHAILAGDKILLTGFVGSLSGQQIIKATVQGTDPITVGLDLAEKLLEQGAESILAQAQRDALQS